MQHSVRFLYRDIPQLASLGVNYKNFLTNTQDIHYEKNQ